MMKINFDKELADRGLSVKESVHVPMYPIIISWEAFEESIPLKCRMAVDYFAKSDIPNEAFFQYGFGMRCIDLIRTVDSMDIPKTENCVFAELPAERQSEQ